MPLSAASATAIKGSAGALEGKAEALTSKMYENIFANYPAIKGVFSPAEHAPGADGTSPQSKKLAAALVAFAKNCDNEGALKDTVGKIGARHKELGIKDEHFPILGECLLKTMKDVLGCDDSCCTAWKEGYDYLSGLIIAASK